MVYSAIKLHIVIFAKFNSVFEDLRNICSTSIPHKYNKKINMPLIRNCIKLKKQASTKNRSPADTDTMPNSALDLNSPSLLKQWELLD